MTAAQRLLMMGSLVLAGEAVYMLPYALRRDYPDALLEALAITNTELGTLSAMFGVLALLSYFPGGWLADRVSARKLLTLSLGATSAGGVYLSTFPTYTELVALFAFWGVFTILTFWAALIKATRAWGGADGQGRAFGILDGGRGLAAAALGSSGLALFAASEPAGAGLRGVILLYSGFAALAAVLTWRFVPENEGVATPQPHAAPAPPRRHRGERQLGIVLRMPVVWLHAVVILMAYMAYWGTFDLAKLAVDVYGMDGVSAATLSTSALWLRPASALGAGWLADRIGASRVVFIAFTIIAVTYSIFAISSGSNGSLWLLWTNAAATAIAVFALRGVYFALLEEGRVPMALTGTAIGVVSVIGYTPDIFTPLLNGWLLDAFPGARGHRYFFAVLAAGAVIGAAAAAGFRRIVR